MSKQYIFKRAKIQRENIPDFVPYKDREKRSRTLKSLKPGDQTAFFYYRRKRKTKNEIGEDRSKFRKAVGELFHAIAELMVEYENGVMVSRIGLFNFMILPWIKNGINFKYYVEPLFHTDGRFYQPMFFHECAKTSCLRGMRMDHQFNNNVTQSMKEALYAGYRPKFYYQSIKSSFGIKGKWH